MKQKLRVLGIDLAKRVLPATMLDILT